MSFDENALAWGSADFWTVDSEPVFVIGGGGAATDAVDDVSHLLWNIRAAALLPDGRVAMLSPGGERKVLIFEPSGELSVAFGRKGDGPGESARCPKRLERATRGLASRCAFHFRTGRS